MTDSSRIVRFGGSSVRIECLGRAAVQLVDFLYGNLPDRDAPAPHVTLRVEAVPEADRFTLHESDRVHYRGNSLGGLATMLLGQTAYHLSDRSQGGLLLHAAAVTARDSCIVLPGAAGAGKSTLTAWLLSRGFGYLTDELVFIPDGSDEIQPFVRPLKIKTAARRVLDPAVLDFGALAPHIVTGPDATLVPGRVCGRVASAPASGPSLIVFPRYLDTGPFEVERLSKGQAVMRLTTCLLNARNLPGDGFPTVTRLARRVPTYAMSYGDFSQLERWVDRLQRGDVTASSPA